MEYQKIIHLLDNKTNQPPQFSTQKWVETNDDAHAMYNTNSKVNFF